MILKKRRVTQAEIRAVFRRAVKYRYDYLLHQFLPFALGGHRHLLFFLFSITLLFFFFFFFFAPVQWIAPQEHPSNTVVFVTKTLRSHPIFSKFGIHVLLETSLEVTKPQCVVGGIWKPKL